MFCFLQEKQSTPNFPKNEHFWLPDTHTYVCVSGGKKCSFFGKYGVLCFLVTHVLRFALTIYTPLEVLPFSLREEFLNMEFFLVRIFHIQSKYGKIRPRKNSLFRLFSRKVSHFFFKFDVIWCLVDFLAIQLFWSLSKHFTYTVFPVELPCKSSFCINGFILIFENFGSYF